MTAFSDVGQNETGTGSDGLPHEEVVGISVGCFIVGILVGIFLTVAVQRSWQHGSYSISGRQPPASSEYELPELSEPQATYTEIVDTNRQETPSQLTSSPCYLTTGDR